MRRGGRGGNALESGGALIDLEVALGANLLYFWQPDANTVTLNAGNVSSMTERVAGVANMANATGAQQPAYSATGGPNNKPYITMQDTARRLTSTISIGAAHRSGVYAVLRMPNTGALATGVEIGASNDIRLGVTSASTQYHHRIEFTGGDQALNLTVPVFSAAAWHLHAVRPLATGALSQIDGSSTTPNTTGTDTFKAWTVANIGSIGGTLGAGDVAFLCITVEPVAAINTIVRNYVFQEFAL